MLAASRFTRELLLLALTFALPACGEVSVMPSPSPSPTDLAPHASPPAPGPEKPPTSDEHLTFALRTLFLGNTDRDGTPNPSHAWKSYGYDLDGKISTKFSTDLCKPREAALPKNVYPDGDDGIDNAFGNRLLEIILGLWADGPIRVNENIAAGKSTVLLDITGIGPDASYNPLLARAYEGAPRGAPALFDGSDTWPVRPESLALPGDLASSLAVDERSYLVDDTWVGHLQGTLTLPLVLPSADGDVLLRLPIHRPIVTMKLDAIRAHATLGTLAGVIAVEDVVAEAARIFAQLDPSCKPETVQSILTHVAQAADILLDGSQDPSRECDGVSIGIGFEAARASLGDVGEPVPESPSCL
jgi:hypothetical protein